MEVGEIFKERARRRLEDLGWTHGDLAKRLGVGRGTVSTYLQKDANTAPQADTLIRWADALGVTVEWLLGREAAPPAAPGPTEAQLEALVEMARAVGVEGKRLSALRAVLFAEDGELRGISAACVPVDKRLTSGKKDQSSG